MEDVPPAANRSAGAAEDWVAMAAADNARWCESVCRAHGLAGRFSPGAWTSSVRTPPFYPDAVTLDPAVQAADILGAIDTSAGCSVKDSFANLDLSDAGFEVLFDASWIHRDPTDPGRSVAGVPTWTRATDPADLAGIDFVVDFPPELLADQTVTVLGARVGERWTDAVILTRRDAVVGLSNLVVGDDPERAWAGAVTAIDSMFPGKSIVGYEHGEDLEHAVQQGFTPIGPLRVWLKN
jgi:hypothetical protein